MPLHRHGHQPNTTRRTAREKALDPWRHGAGCRPPAHAQQSKSMEQILRELEALNARVGKLEQDNVQLRTENAALKESTERTEATSEYLKDNASATRKQLTRTARKLPRPSASRKPPNGHRASTGKPTCATATNSWIRKRPTTSRRASDPRAARDDREDQRHADRHDRLATNGGSGDPRSTNQTLGEGWTRKGIAVDLAYVDWKPR